MAVSGGLGLRRQAAQAAACSGFPHHPIRPGIPYSPFEEVKVTLEASDFLARFIEGDGAEAQHRVRAWDGSVRFNIGRYEDFLHVSLYTKLLGVWSLVYRGSMLKLYTVVLKHEIVVVAESESDAEDHARDAIDDLDPQDCHTTATEMRHLPVDWELSSIPYGESSSEDPDRTIKGWIDQGAGAAYQKLQATEEP
jgi:hypothetical protein